jgi:hypothetical protein
MSEGTARKAVQKEGESEAPGTASIQSKTSWFNRRLFAVRILATKEHASVRCCSSEASPFARRSDLLSA